MPRPLEAFARFACPESLPNQWLQLLLSWTSTIRELRPNIAMGGTWVDNLFGGIYEVATHKRHQILCGPLTPSHTIPILLTGLKHAISSIPGIETTSSCRGATRGGQLAAKQGTHVEADQRDDGGHPATWQLLFWGWLGSGVMGTCWAV